MSTLRLAALPLSKSQVSQFKKAYTAGDVATEVLFNLLYNPQLRDSPPPVMGLEVLGVPKLDPVHFGFIGNRSYQMQVVGNGDTYGILSHQRVSTAKGQAHLLPVITVRLELITASNLPFLKVAQAPSVPQIRQVYTDQIEWCVEGFNRVKLTATPDQFEFLGGFGLMHCQDEKSKALRAKILSGHPVQEAFVEWVSSPVATPAVLPRPR
jgi:hypothetical protein